MKILQVIPSFIPAYSYGGPLKVCFDVSRELVKRGHQVTVATTDALDDANRLVALEETREGVQILRFRNISNRLAKQFNGYLPIGYYRWAKLNMAKYDIVHCHDTFTLQNIITSHFCSKYNIPYLVQPHGTLSPVSQKSRFKLIKRGFLKLFSNVFSKAKHIITLTENEKQQVTSIYPNLSSKIEVIPNGIKLDDFQNILKIDLHEKYQLPKANHIIGFIGRMQYIKGIDISLDILAELKGKLDFTYLLIGPDEGEKDKLDKLIGEHGLQDHVHYTGILKGQEKMETIKACDLFLFTSRSEGLPMTVLEVAALGVPQIISNTCNVPEVGESKAGFEIDLVDKEAFVEKIYQVLKDTDLHESLSRNTRTMVSNHFDLKAICDRIEEVLS